MIVSQIASGSRYAKVVSTWQENTPHDKAFFIAYVDCKVGMNIWFRMGTNKKETLTTTNVVTVDPEKHRSKPLWITAVAASFVWSRTSLYPRCPLPTVANVNVESQEMAFVDDTCIHGGIVLARASKLFSAAYSKKEVWTCRV